jgi:HD-GYP domain-containing protein (c-di-GMP phosphodiesterase class II)
MMAHRPYRAGLGIEAALEEISSKRGTVFYPEAVDICVKLFREKRLSNVESLQTAPDVLEETFLESQAG